MTTNNLAAQIDAFAQLEAEFKALKKEYEKAKEGIRALGQGTHIGEFYTVTYKRTQAQSLFDKEGAKARAKEEAIGLTDEQVDYVFGATKLGSGQDRIEVEATAPSTWAHAA